MPHNNTKKRIFDASVELFSEKGYDDVSMREIAEKVGIVESAIYRHYKSKQLILDDIFDQYHREINNTFLNKEQIDRYIETDSPHQLLERLIIQFHKADNQFMIDAYRITCRESLINQAANDILVHVLNDTIAGSIKYVLDQLVICGNIPEMDTLSCSLLWTRATLSMGVIWVSNFSDRKELDEVEKEWSEMSMRFIEMALNGKIS